VPERGRFSDNRRYDQKHHLRKDGNTAEGTVAGMTPFACLSLILGLTAQVSQRTYGVPDWLAGILMICGLIFLIGIIPLVVLFMATFECRRRRNNDTW
jgi:hypothetical protein